MTSPAVGTGIIAFIDARLAEAEEHVIREGGECPSGARSCARSLRRVLADVAKDRAILALHRPYRYQDQVVNCDECDLEYPCQTVRLLAAIDADHPGFDPSWKPVAG